MQQESLLQHPSPAPSPNSNSSGFECPDVFTVDLVSVNPSRLLTPSDGNWMDTVALVRITITRATNVANLTSNTTSMICEIRLLHAAYVNLVRDAASTLSKHRSKSHFD